MESVRSGLAAFPGLVSPGSVGRQTHPCLSKDVCDPVMTYDLFNGSLEPHLSFPTIALPFSSHGKPQITGKNSGRFLLPPDYDVSQSVFIFGEYIEFYLL